MLSVHTLPRTTFSILIVLAMRRAPALGADRSAGETREEWAGEVNGQERPPWSRLRYLFHGWTVSHGLSPIAKPLCTKARRRSEPQRGSGGKLACHEYENSNGTGHILHIKRLSYGTETKIITTAFCPGLSPSQEWAIKAHVLIDELLEISRDVAKTEQEANAITLRGERTGKLEEMMADLVLLTLQSWGIREKADGVLWKLWLTTGKVPTPQKKSESLSANLSRNVREFRAYVTTHATATEEELVRLGLTNAVWVHLDHRCGTRTQAGSGLAKGNMSECRNCRIRY